MKVLSLNTRFEFEFEFFGVCVNCVNSRVVSMCMCFASEFYSALPLLFFALVFHFPMKQKKTVTVLFQIPFPIPLLIRKFQSMPISQNEKLYFAVDPGHTS